MTVCFERFEECMDKHVSFSTHSSNPSKQTISIDCQVRHKFYHFFFFNTNVYTFIGIINIKNMINVFQSIIMILKKM